MSKKIYIASSLGFSESGRYFLYEKIIPIIESAGFIPLDPWTLTDEKKIESVINLPLNEEKIKSLKELNGLIGKNNCDAISESHCMFAVLDGSDVDSGTAAEIGYACALGKKIIGYRNDFRISGDNEGSVVNLQIEYFIVKSGGRIIQMIDFLEDELLLINKS